MSVLSTIDACVGSNLRLRRIASGQSVDEIALSVGVCSILWAKWEDGQARVSATDMFLLKETIGINPSDLFSGLVARADEALL